MQKREIPFVCSYLLNSSRQTTKVQTEAWEVASQQGDLGEARKEWGMGTGLGSPAIAFLLKEKE